MADANPAVSVVIPTYNRAGFLRLAVESVQAQTFRVAEIIVVDDGSTDDTRAQVAQMQEEDPRITLIVQKNSGANVARNAGVAAATAPWIAFLDSDDRWKAEKLKAQMAALRANPDAVASFTGITAVHGDKPLFDYETPATLSLDELRMHNVLGSTSTAVIAKEALLEAGGFDASMPSCQDWDLWFRVRKLGPFAIVPASLTLYEDGPHDRISGNIGKAEAGHRLVFARTLEGVTDPDLARRVRASHDLVLARVYQNHGQHGPMLRRSLASFAGQPSRVAGRLAIRAVRRMLRRKRS